MNAYLILPNVDKDGIVTKYVEEKGIKIPKENILTIDEFNNIKDYPSIIFFVKYDSTRKSHLEIVSNNKSVKGYNVSIDGDDHIYKIDRRLDMPNANDMNSITQRIKNIDRKIDNIEFEEHFSEREGKMLVINSCKGGVGKSFLSFNLAYLASKLKKNKRKILLVDYNLSEGSLSRYFTESSQHIGKIDSLVDYYLTYGTIDKDHLKDVIISHPKLSLSKEVMVDLDVLFAPDNFSVTPRKINSNPAFNMQLFKILKYNYDLIIIDTSNEKNLSFNDYLIQNADKVFFVISTNPNSIIQVKEYIDELSIYQDKYDIVYNDYNTVSERFSIDTIVSFLYKANKATPLNKRDIDKIINNNFFVLDTNIGIKKADHHWDTIFNKYKQYLSVKDIDKYTNIFYLMLKNNFPELILNVDNIKNKGGIFEKIKSIFKFIKFK